MKACVELCVFLQSCFVFLCPSMKDFVIHSCKILYVINTCVCF